MTTNKVYIDGSCGFKTVADILPAHSKRVGYLNYFYKETIPVSDSLISTIGPWHFPILMLWRRWKNLGVQHVIKPRRNISRTFLTARWSKLSARGSELSARWSKMSARTFLRGVMICCTPRFFYRWFVVRMGPGIS